MKLKHITAATAGIAAGAVTMLHFAIRGGDVLEAAIVTVGMAILGVLVVLAATENKEDKPREQRPMRPYDFK